jgi:tetratricopeptide (TPR) repeat protein
MTGGRAAGFVAQAAWLAAFAAAAVWSVRVGVADGWAGLETVAGTEQAIAWMPQRAEYHVRLALLLSDTDASRSEAELRRAAALQPTDARTWIELGLRHEARGEYAEAEQCLLRAGEEDKQYLPRWTLTNYYYRRDDTERFWEWAAAAARMMPGDPMPLFQLCGRVVEDGRLMERLAIRDPDVRAAYLAYLVGGGRVEVAGKATAGVLEANRSEDVPLLMTACDRMVEDARPGQALAIWNQLAAHGRIPFETLDPAQGRSLTNGEFAIAPTSRGFDWRLPGVEGVSSSREENRPGLRLTFSGRQPESCEALVQYLPVLEKEIFELRFVYQTSGIPAGSGLSWRLTDVNGGGSLVLGKAGEDGKGVGDVTGLSAEVEARGKLAFVAPAGCRFVRLALTYQRATGTTRIEGYIILRRMALSRTAQLPSEAGGRSRVT